MEAITILWFGFVPNWTESDIGLTLIMGDGMLTWKEDYATSQRFNDKES